jgi:stalled ribosome rescue protein Dom34
MLSHLTVVWIDHKEARVLRVDGSDVDASSVHAPLAHVHRHPKGGTAESNHPDDLNHFFDDVARALEGQHSILLVGPSIAKTQFFRHLKKHHDAVEKNIVGVETVDHPTDKQLVAHAKHYFGITIPRV